MSTNELLESGKALVDKHPHKADTGTLVCGLLVLLVINTKTPDWSDVLCAAVGWANIGFYAFRFFRYRKWEKQRDVWIQESREAREKPVRQSTGRRR